ncbi:MAG: FG-GAP repeat domain-containing protein [Bryobacteraceae bacterium]
MNSVKPGLLLVFFGAAAWVVHSAASGNIRFSNRLISGDYTYPYGIGLVDLDKDGDLDVVSTDCTTVGSRKHNDIYWFENDGKGNFVRHFLAKDDWYGRYERFRAADLNGDGNPDIVIVDNFHGHLVWFENSGRPRDGQLWKRHVITQGGLLGAYDVDVADFDGDGRPDVTASSWRMGNQFTWYENPGAGSGAEWTSHVIDSNQAETRTVAAADFNRDGRPDVLGSVTTAGIVLWYENPGNPRQRPWRRHVIDLTAHPMHGHPADLDGDGDVDVLMAFGGAAQGGAGYHEIVWYENAGKPGDGSRWVKHVIGEQFRFGFEAVAADLDGDGRLEVVASSGRGGQLAWFRHGGDPVGPWTMHSLMTNWAAAVQVVAGDVDRDGRTDIVAVAEKSSLELRWWRNEGGAK